jgi:excisionase family DNA binding protein
MKPASIGSGFAFSGDSPPGYLSVKDAAKYASLSERTIRSMLSRDTANALPCRRVGRKVLIKRVELEAYLDAYQVSGRPGVVQALKELGIESSERRVQKRGHVAA